MSSSIQPFPQQGTEGQQLIRRPGSLACRILDRDAGAAPQQQLRRGGEGGRLPPAAPIKRVALAPVVTAVSAHPVRSDGDPGHVVLELGAAKRKSLSSPTN